MLLLSCLAIAFKGWMLLDAVRRRVALPWYLLVLAPFGDVAYFFTVKLPAFRKRSTPAAATPAVARERALVAFERAAAETPSFANRVRLAWALLERGNPKRAQALFQLALSTHKNDREARFGLGLAQLEGEDAAGAVATLSPLVDRALDYEQYSAALALAEALYRAGDRQATLDLLRNVSHDSKRLEHRLLLARYQLRDDDKAEARETLRAALSEFEGQPEPIRMRNGAVATEARRLLRTLDHQLSS